MSFDAQSLYRLLPAIHRIRDDAEGRPLRALVAVLAEQLQVIEENIEQLYDDQFIETCAEWVVPYIGDLVGYRPLHTKAGAGLGGGSPRAEVAHTIALRRRKGTAAVLEQLARDVSGWDARAVEFFQWLATTQYMNHLRPANHQAPDLRRWEPLERLGTAFDTVARTADVRRIGSVRVGTQGRHNVPNVGLFLFPIGAQPATRVPAVPVDARRWRISPLGHDMPLYNRPLAEDGISHIAEPENVPLPLSRRVLERDLAATPPSRPVYYGADLSLAIYLDGAADPVPAAGVTACDLSDDAGTWAHLPDAGVAVDPVLGRVALPAGSGVTAIDVTCHTGFSADIGGGEYERAATFAAGPAQVVLRVPGDHPTIQAALDALGGDGVVAIADNGRYEETPAVHVRAGGRIELRCANERRCALVLGGDLAVTGEEGAEFALNGLLVSGGQVRVPATAGNELARLRVTHATLVPGRTLAPDGAPGSPGAPALAVEIAGTSVTVDSAIVGALRVHEGSTVAARDSIVDACAADAVAFAAADGAAAGGGLSLDGCTVIGKVHAAAMPLVSNSLLLARPAAGDTWAAPVLVQRRQAGCVRFSWLPPQARVPRRHRCQPGADGVPSPRMMSLRYGTAVYCRLSAATPEAIRRGADDEGEMGAFHHLLAAQRETNVRLRLAEYLRVGLEAGVLFDIRGES